MFHRKANLGIGTTAMNAVSMHLHTQMTHDGVWRQTSTAWLPQCWWHVVAYAAIGNCWPIRMAVREVCRLCQRHASVHDNSNDNSSSVLGQLPL